VTENTFSRFSLLSMATLQRGTDNKLRRSISYHWRFPCREKKTHIPPTISFLDLAKTEQTCSLPKHFLCYLAHIWQASRSFIAYTNALLIRHTTDRSEVKTPVLMYSISFKLDADFSERRFRFDPGYFTRYSRHMQWYSSRSPRCPFRFSLPVITQPLLRSGTWGHSPYDKLSSLRSFKLVASSLIWSSPHIWRETFLISDSDLVSSLTLNMSHLQWRTGGGEGGGGGGGSRPPPPEIPKALQNRAKLSPTVKTVKNCWI